MTRISVARLLTAAMLLILPTMLAGSVAGPVHAQPDQDTASEPNAQDVAFAWPTLGLERQIYLGPYSPYSFTVPVPAGLAATRLLGTIRSQKNIGAGFLEIEDGDGNFLAAVELPPAASAQAVIPFDVDISAARFRASSIGLTFTVRQVGGFDEICGPIQELVLTDMATVFTGAEPPTTTVANFFPPVLEQVTIYAPTDADFAEQQTVLTLASTLTRLYDPQRLAVRVASQPRGAAPPPATQLSRAILVETGPPGLTVENAGTPNVYLRVSGSGDALTTQTSLFVNQLQTMVQVPTARVDQAGSDALPTGDTLTFSQLKISGETNVLRTGGMTVGVDRAALGAGRVDGVQVHLLADYTPVPDDDRATVVIRSGGFVVYAGSLDHTGLLDATFNLDSQTLGQRINLDFALTYTPRQICGPLIAPMNFQIDPRSTLTMRRGGTPPGGFSAVPSEFNPSFMVALDGSSPNQLDYAARVVAAIARLTSRQLTPQVVNLKEAADATIGALIVANSEAIKQTSLNPPVRGDGPAINFELPADLNVNIEDGIGSIQAFADPPRNRSVVLVTTTGAWNLVVPLFSYIDGLDGGWSQLTGDVLAAGAAGTPTNVAIRASGESTFETVEPPPLLGSLNPRILIGVGVAVVAAIASATLWARRRRTTKAGAPDDGNVTEPERSE